MEPQLQRGCASWRRHWRGVQPRWGCGLLAGGDRVGSQARQPCPLLCERPWRSRRRPGALAFAVPAPAAAVPVVAVVAGIERQRRSTTQPRVGARHERLPWVAVTPAANPNGVAQQRTRRARRGEAATKVMNGHKKAQEAQKRRRIIIMSLRFFAPLCGHSKHARAIGKIHSRPIHHGGHREHGGRHSSPCSRCPPW
jgi:hypothetical protein